MPRKIVVTTTSWGLPGGGDPARNLTLAESLLDAAGSQRPDLVCLPETFPHIGVPSARASDSAETIPGPTFDLLAGKARQYGMNVVGGLFELRGEQIFNTACVIDRQGHLIGQYDKVHPTINEISGGVMPGVRPLVFDTDIGRIGVAICYDIGWPDIWSELDRLGAELVVWPSAYDGGFPLQTYAWRHFYYIVTSVWSYHSRILDVTGEILDSTSRFSRLVTQEIDLEKQVFHTDGHTLKLLEMATHLGRRVSLHACTEEHIFTLASNDPTLSVERIVHDFGLESFRVYHRRAERVQEAARDAAARAGASPRALAGIAGGER